MKKSLCTALLALGALTLLPQTASADHRFGTDRGSRYGGGHGYRGGHSDSSFGVSIGFGSGGHHRGGYSDLHFGYSSPTYYRGGYTRYYPPAYSYPAPVVYAPAPRVVYVAPPPVVYYSPPVYTSSYYYSSGGYYCGR